jgi:hypothetical protein
MMGQERLKLEHTCMLLCNPKYRFHNEFGKGPNRTETKRKLKKQSMIVHDIIYWNRGPVKLGQNPVTVNNTSEEMKPMSEHAQTTRLQKNKA